MSYRFTIPHALAERTRIRWAGAADERDAVTELALRIGDLDGVSHAQSRPLTGSIIIDHHGIEWTQLARRLQAELSIEFEVDREPHRATGIERFNDGVASLERGLGRVDVDLPSLSLLLVLAMAAAQALRGNVATSSMSLLWYAMTIASRARDS